MDALDAIVALDTSVLRRALGEPAWALPAFYAATVVGAGWGLFALVPFLVLPRTRRVTGVLLVALGVTNLLVSVLKWMVGRVRPCDALEWCHPIFVASPGGGSLPSGHAAGAFAFAAFVATREPRYALPLALYAVLVAWSRCALGVHYPLDVFAGAALGGTVGFAFARWSLVRGIGGAAEPNRV
jgi:undecaprenyl-diphosphatase